MPKNVVKFTLQYLRNGSRYGPG